MANPGYNKIKNILHVFILAGCITNEDCPPNEDCLFTSHAYECVCKEGLVRDSQQICVQLTGTCGGGTCAENAECLFDETYQTYYCTCKSDYVGDGITECKPAPIGCNVLNNCGLHADCVYDQEQGSYKCTCAEGKYF